MLEPGNLLDELVLLLTKVFCSADDLAGRMVGKSKLRIDVAMDGDRLVGYKIGYALNQQRFFSFNSNTYKE